MNEIKIISRDRRPEPIDRSACKPKKENKINSNKKIERFIPGIIAIISIVTYFLFAFFFGVDHFLDNLLGLISGFTVITIYKRISSSKSVFLKIAKIILFYTFIFSVAYHYYKDESRLNESTIINTESPIFYDYVGSYPLMVGRDEISDWITIGPCHSYNFSHDQIEMLPKDGPPIKVWQIERLPNNVTTFKIINRSDKPVSLLIKS